MTAAEGAIISAEKNKTARDIWIKLDQWRWQLERLGDYS